MISITLSGRTSLMITPNSYKFKVIDHLVTNFHAPDSTLSKCYIGNLVCMHSTYLITITSVLYLVLLVSAFLGKQTDVTKVYENAMDRDYKFLSYGDACLFSRPGAKLPSEE